MEYLVGILLALAVCIFALLTGFDRDRAFYSTVVIVVAHYYILFAVMGATTRVMIAESLGATAFILFAVIGFKTSPWIVAAALAVGGGLGYSSESFALGLDYAYKYMGLLGPTNFFSISLGW